MSQTTERAFETYVEEILLTRGDWKPGSVAEWDKERALFPAQVFAFIQDTQPKPWAEMKAQHPEGLERAARSVALRMAPVAAWKGVAEAGRSAIHRRDQFRLDGSLSGDRQPDGTTIKTTP